MADKFDPDNPQWLRQPKEPTMWFERFVRYRDMGADRTVLGCFNILKKEAGDYKGDKHGNAPCLPGAWKKQTAKWDWKGRAEAWDDFQHHQKERKREKQREQIEDEEFLASLTAIQKARKMLDWPLAQREVLDEDENGNPIKVQVKPAGWSQGTAANLLKAGSEVARRALSMATGSPGGPGAAQKGPGDGDDGEYLDDADIEWMYEYMEDPSEVPAPPPPTIED